MAVLGAMSLAACVRAPVPVPSEDRLIGSGMASYYGAELRGRRTYSGERFDPDDFTAAHRTLPMGACAVVVSAHNGRAVRVRVNDRGPHTRAREIDVSLAAAHQLDMVGRGVTRVRVYRCD